MVCFIANRWQRVWRDGDIDNDLAKEFTVSVEYLDSMISAVRDINIVLRVHRNAVGRGELTRLVAWFTP